MPDDVRPLVLDMIHRLQYDRHKHAPTSRNSFMRTTGEFIKVYNEVIKERQVHQMNWVEIGKTILKRFNSDLSLGIVMRT